MAQRPSNLVTTSTVGLAANKWQNLRKTTNEVAQTMSQDEQRNQNYAERYRLLLPKVERCLQELVERIHKQNSSLSFELLAPPASHLAAYFINDNKEFFFDFYLVWKNTGKIQIEKDESSVCCKIKYIDRLSRWSRAEQSRLLISNVNKRSSYLNGRAMRDLVFETLQSISPDLIRLDFIEHLIYFDLIIPVASEKTTCHITLLPSIHVSAANEALLPFGTLRWYPRSLLPPVENCILNSLQQPLQNMSIRRYIAAQEIIDESSKLSKKDLQAFARVRVIIRELLFVCGLEHLDSIEQLQMPFENDQDGSKKVFFVPHRFDRNCNIFPAGQYLLDDPKAKRFFIQLLKTNIKTVEEAVQDNVETNA